MKPIPHIDNPSPEELDRNYLAKNEPVIITNGLAYLGSGQHSARSWTLDYIAEHCDSGVVTMRLRNYLKLVTEGQPGYPRYYQKNRALETILPQIAHHVPLPRYVDLSNVPEKYRHEQTSLYIGRDAQTRMHFHTAMEAVAVVLMGKKDFLLVPPQDSKNMYANPWLTWLRSRFGDELAFSHGLSESDILFSKNKRLGDEHPRFDNADKYFCTVNAGEILFIPVHWWHAIYTHDEPTIMLVHFFPSRLRRWIGQSLALRSIVSSTYTKVALWWSHLRA
jgi:hypothetical protein